MLSACQSNDDCEQSYLCIRNICENPCLTYNPCPLNVSCVVVNKTVTCLCLEAGLAHNIDCHVNPGNENYVKFKKIILWDNHLIYVICLAFLISNIVASMRSTLASQIQ